jgi:hypothetical protein
MLTLHREVIGALAQSDPGGSDRSGMIKPDPV